jgi:putative hydrolase of the HAD superfamily
MSAELRALLCDAGGTLIRTREPPALTYCRFAAAHGIACDRAAVEARLREALTALRPPDGALETFAAREREDWRGVVRASLGTDAADGACFGALFAFYASAAAWEVLPGAPAALAAARARGWRTAVASNMDHRLPGVLAELDLAPRFDAVVIPSSCGFAKPDRRFFLAACARLGVAPGASLYVGDREKDCVAAARAAGLAALRYDPTGSGADTLRSWEAMAVRMAERGWRGGETG